MAALNPELLAWTALLGRFIDLVKAGKGMPTTGAGPKWAASIEPIILMQATAFALDDLASLPEADRPLARDRAEVQLTTALEQAEAIWTAPLVPGAIREIEAAANEALESAIYAGLRWQRWNGPGFFEVPEVELPPAHGTCALMQPGTLVLPGEPVAWFTECEPPLENARLETIEGPPVQVQRFIEEGRIAYDQMTTLDAPIRGVPLLVPIALEGRAIGHFTVERIAWREAQEAMLKEPLPEVRGLPART
jgi:hypothetical protein